MLRLPDSSLHSVTPGGWAGVIHFQGPCVPFTRPGTVWALTETPTQKEAAESQ